MGGDHRGTYKVKGGTITLTIGNSDHDALKLQPDGSILDEDIFITRTWVKE